MSISIVPLREIGMAMLISNGVSHEHDVIVRQSEKANFHFRSASSNANKSVENRFRSLAAEWRSKRGPTSSVKEMSADPAYQQIIGMGKSALPLILRELENSTDHWFWALWAITGVDPVRRENKGRIRQMASDWLAWARSEDISW